jgi:flagellar P-ring protein precursor FlgI
MRLRRLAGLLICAVALATGPGPAAATAPVRVKDLGRFLGWRENALVGYGVVVGLSGSGDSPRSEVTRQAMRNVLSRMGANLLPEQVQSRNVAAVIVTANLPPSAHVGDPIDVNVSSIGDARSIAGGTLLMTPLQAPDRRVYALAQGPLVVGGHRFDADLNSQQRNYPTSGRIPGGATVETPVSANLVDAQGDLTFVLNDPDPATAQRIAQAVDAAVPGARARVRDAASIQFSAAAAGDVNGLVARLGELSVSPDQRARVVINERTGTIVAGGDVRISSVVVSQGDIRVTVKAERTASQPEGYAGYDAGQGDGFGGVRSLVVTNTKLDVAEGKADAVRHFPDTTVTDLVEGLTRLKVSTRGVIAVLQAVRAAGALHAELVVQ